MVSSFPGSSMLVDSILREAVEMLEAEGQTEAAEAVQTVVAVVDLRAEEAESFLEEEEVANLEAAAGNCLAKVASWAVGRSTVAVEADSIL